METQSRRSGQHPPVWLRAVVDALIPRACIEDISGDLYEDYVSMRQFLWTAASILGVYLAGQIRRAFNIKFFGVEAVALYIAFAGAANTMTVFVVIAVALAVLLLRDAYSYPETVSPTKSTLDVIIATTAGFLSQALIGLIAPSLTINEEIMYRGAALSLLLLSTARMVFRRSDTLATRDLHRHLRRAYQSTWALNILWLIAVLMFIFTNAEAMPASREGRDLLFSLLPLVFLFMVYRLQSNLPVENPFLDSSVSSFSFWGMDDTKSRAWYLSAEALFFSSIAAPLALAIWNGLSGPQVTVYWLRIVTNLSALLVLTVVWMQIKGANRATAAMIQNNDRLPLGEGGEYSN